MLSFGERLKNFRKMAGLTQAELAEKQGVSVQTVSRWENDVGMPDIIQIVPLSKILGINLEALLGVVTNEMEEIDEAFSIANNIIRKNVNNQKLGERNCDRYKEIYETLRETVRRFPYNYEIALRCGSAGARYYDDAVWRGFFDLTEKEKNDLFRELEKMLENIVNNDEDLERKVKAKKHLIRLYSAQGDYEQAEKEAELLPFEQKLDARYLIAHRSSNYDKMQEILRYNLSEKTLDYLWIMYNTGSSYSINGALGRPASIAIWKKIIDICRLVNDTMWGDEINAVEIATLIRLAKDYLRDGEYDKTIDCGEELINVFERNINFYKTLNNGSCSMEDPIYTKRSKDYIANKVDLQWIISSYRSMLCDCWNDFEDKTGNPVVTNPRWKDIEKKLNDIL
ncbi:MAG: helix-turn-helix transcriptional regulator [Clostridia bacterium]|nr:helix-turn-helix transcriptional regulator [Clostridia bacterium]